jgi:DNA-binding NarL/FixJ family response regulator
MAAGQSQTIKVMLVDDVDHVRRMLRNMLDLDGFEVVAEASDGHTAVSSIADADPDVVVIDYSMPDMDGIETARQIRAARPEQLMIMYTAYLQPVVEARAREVGVALVLGQVEGLEALEREISRLVGTLF